MPATISGKDLAVFNWDGSSHKSYSYGHFYDTNKNIFVANEQFESAYSDASSVIDGKMFPLANPHKQIAAYRYANYQWIRDTSGREQPIYCPRGLGLELNEAMRTQGLPQSSIEIPLTSLDIANNVLIGSFGPLLMVVPPTKAKKILAGNTNQKYLATTTEGLFTEARPAIEHEKASISKILRGHCFLPILVLRKRSHDQEKPSLTLAVMLVASVGRIRKAIKNRPELLNLLIQLAGASLVRPMTKAEYNNKQVSKYWPSAKCLPKNFNPDTISVPKVKPLAESQYSKLNKSYALRRHPQYATYQNLNQKITAVKKIAIALSEDEQRQQEAINSLKAQIEEQERRLAEVKTSAISTSSKLEKLQKKTQETLDEINRNPAPSSNDYLQNYLQNLDVRLLNYTMDSSGQRIQTLEFETTKPHIIQVVDSTRAHLEDRVGGPWRVKIDYDGVKLAPANPHTIRALVAPHQWRIHPHEPSRVLTEGFERLVDYGGWICEGELAPNLNKAKNNGDIKVVIMAVLTWLHCAFASDDWGRYYRSFPVPAEVSFDGKTSTALSLTHSEPEVKKWETCDGEIAFSIQNGQICHIFMDPDTSFFKNYERPTVTELLQYGKFYNSYSIIHSSTESTCRDELERYVVEADWEEIEMNEEDSVSSDVEVSIVNENSYNSIRRANA